MGKEIFIIGAGTYGEAMYELASMLGYVVGGYYDDSVKIGTTVMGSGIIGTTEGLVEFANKNYIVAIGNCEVRSKLMRKIRGNGGNTPTLIHPKAAVSQSAEIGNGVYIQANACIWTKVKIGDYCIISPNVVIAHHTVIGEACLVSTLSGVGASIVLEDKVFLGMGSTVITGVKKVGRNSIIGAGSVVLKDIPQNSVYAGVPAKKIRDI